MYVDIDCQVSHVESIAERIEIWVSQAGQIGYAIDCAMQKGVKDRALVPDQVVSRIMADMCARSEFSHRELHSAQFPDQLFSSAENTTAAFLLVLLTYNYSRTPTEIERESSRDSACKYVKISVAAATL